VSAPLGNALEPVGQQTPDAVRALLNILEDFAEEKTRLEEAQRAVLNILDDLDVEKRTAEEASRMKSAFVANMSHELRTPLNAIMGFTKLLVHERVGSLSPRQRDFLGDILKSSQHLLQLINDVLDLAKVESGRMEFHPEPIVTEAIVGEVCDVLRPSSSEKEIVVSAQVLPAAGRVFLDPARLRQVLYNYVSNAIKFTHRGGHVSVRVARDADALRIEVTDDGIGIRRDDLAALFTEFRQIDSGSSKRYAGTGLGLALTRRIVEAQGGRVGVESVEGVGSTFVASIPCTWDGSPH
jgi:signal transduction histidine kinase